jgi:probable phosphoglycerate mutase
MVRHGESTWNVEGRWQGQVDAPLSELGQRQAHAAGDSVGAVDAVVASDLERALITAALIAEPSGIGPVHTDVRLRERSAGPWEGLTRDQIEEQYPGWLAAHKRPDGFEPDDELCARVLEALAELAAFFGDAYVLVVTHGGVIRALERELGEDRGPVPNLGGMELEHDGERAYVRERVLLIDPDDVEVTIPGQI